MFYNGVADMIFMHEGAYYVLDWKTNRSPSREYGQDDLAGMMAAPDFFDMLSASMAQVDPATAALAAGYAKATSNMDLYMDQNGFGITPIFGIDVKTGKWNFGLKYEMNTDIETKNETKINRYRLCSPGKSRRHPRHGDDRRVLRNPR